MRVSLGPGDVDCRPWYEADPSDWIAKAVVASEDGSFWEHCGVRPLSAFRALMQNVVGGRRVSGASTITMQAVRLIRPHRKSYAQKWAEAVRAVKMERAKSKSWILSQYLNRAPFGSNLVGIEAGAMGWFGKGAKDLGLGEAALLAGMLQAPSRFRPDRGLAKALARRDYVLARMVKLGYITEAQAEGAKGVVPEVRRAPRPFRHPHYCDWYAATFAPGSSDVVTPLDEDVQCACERAVADAATVDGRSAAVVVMKVATGDVVAMASSGDYFAKDEGQFNAALGARPAGSTLKPFLAALAMDAGFAGPATSIPDEPLAVKGYRPTNFDGRFRGDVSLGDSLVMSLNVPFVRLCRKVGVDRFGALLGELGFATMGTDYASYGLGLSIGGADVTLVELVGAYRRLSLAALGAGGAEGSSVSSEAAYLVTQALSGSERGAAALGHVADVELPRFAWKTGTSSAYRDAWTVLWNPEYVVGVWCGRMSGGFGDSKIVGARAAAPLAWKVARTLYPGNGGPWFREPAGVQALLARLPGRLEEPCAALAIASPEDGADLRAVDGVPQQGVVCRAVGAASAGRLWWFLDGAAAGESDGGAPFVAEVPPGEHVLACSTAAGEVAEVHFTKSEVRFAAIE